MDRVLLLSLPWATPVEPNLGLGVLKAVYTEAGIPCDIYETQLDLLRWVSNSTYEDLAQSWALCDFIFSGQLEAGASPRRLKIVKDICLDDQGHDGRVNFEKGAEERFQKSLTLRHEIVPRFFDSILERLDLSSYCMVGFTCLFDQTIASLAFARRLRELRPDLTLVFGGYALQEPVGPHLQSVFPELMTVIAYGDGEPVAVPLYEAARGKRDLADVPNISYMDAEGEQRRTQSVQCDLEKSPPPNFDDFFRQRDELETVHRVRIAVPSVPAESSRGCWWGQKSHCVFCGIDDDTMRYRAKSAERVIESLDWVHDRYGVLNYRFSDYIMPHAYYRTLLPMLAERGKPYRIQYESKSNMTPQKMDVVQDGGVFYMQLGVESFSTPVLERMKKGVTSLQNIYSIHGLMRRGITPYYNLLFGFPGDTVADYEQMTEILPTLFHLKPPGLCIWVQITRYAPMSERPQDFGYNEPLTSHWRYDSLFSEEFLAETGLDLTRFCYYFNNYNHPMMGPELRNQFSVLQQQWWHWRQREQRGGSHLSYRTSDDGIEFRDTRAGKKAKITQWSPVHRDLYEAVDGKLATADQIYGACPQHDRKKTRQAIEELREAQMMLAEGAHVMSLAFPREVYDQKVFWWHNETDRYTYLNHNHKSILERRRERNLERVPTTAEQTTASPA